jgi:hypothetical protein
MSGAVTLRPVYALMAWTRALTDCHAFVRRAADCVCVFFFFSSIKCLRPTLMFHVLDIMHDRPMTTTLLRICACSLPYTSCTDGPTMLPSATGHDLELYLARRFLL